MTKHLSPALRHQQRVLTQRASGHTEPGQPTTGSQYELQLYKLAEDKRRLKAIQSVQNKIELKAQLLPGYAPWIDGVLASGKGGQDDVLTTVLVWHIDVGDYDRALHIATYAIQHNMTLPDQYSRDIPTLLMDEFAGAYLHGNLAHDPEQAVRVLKAIYALTENHDAPDQARAKLLKALAFAQIKTIGEPDEQHGWSSNEITLAQEAHQHLLNALALFAGAGVKKDIERLERRLKNLSASGDGKSTPAHGGAG